jgi:hypothetical protein
MRCAFFLTPSEVAKQTTFFHYRFSQAKTFQLFVFFFMQLESDRVSLAQNHYQVLVVPFNANRRNIKEAFKIVALLSLSTSVLLQIAIKLINENKFDKTTQSALDSFFFLNGNFSIFFWQRQLLLSYA